MNSSVIAREIEKFIDDGICLIPTDNEKVPHIGYKNLGKPLSKMFLFDLMGKYDTNCVAMLCGEASGGLFCIDFDVKNKRELEFIFIENFLETFPELEYRVERTPSGGYHILYRIIEFCVPIEERSDEFKEFPASRKIASRKSNEQELLINPKEKTKCFIESRAAKSLAQCYPSDGYSYISGRIGKISWKDHIRIILYLESFNEVYRDLPVREKKTSEWYLEGESPFDAFGRSAEAESILLEAGWKVYKENNRYVLYTKPGSKNKSSAGRRISDNSYNIFTTDTELESGVYKPSYLLGLVRFAGDFSELYRYLVDQGYGRYKGKIEKEIAKKIVRLGGEIPKNFSEDGRKVFEEEREKFDKEYPYGVFWEVEEGVVRISQKRIDEVLLEMKFRYMEDVGLVLMDGYLVRMVTPEIVSHYLLLYIFREKYSFENPKSVFSEEKDLEGVYNEYSRFIEKYRKQTIERIGMYGKIGQENVLKSNALVSYKFYKNCFLEINRKGYVKREYKDLELFEKMVLQRDIIDRDFLELTLENCGRYVENGVPDFRKCYYFDYLNKALMYDIYLMSVIGYLTHEFVDDTTNAIVIATEKIPNDIKGGGAGKDLFFKILSHTTSVKVLDGATADLDKQFLQSYEGERIVVLSDAPEKFNIQFFKNMGSGEMPIKKLFKDVRYLRRDMMPKPCITSNYSYKMLPGLERRVVDLEFSTFFHEIEGGVKGYYGIKFPSTEGRKGDWKEEDWIMFDYMVIECIKVYLQDGLLSKTKSDIGWERQFSYQHGHLLDFFNLHMKGWIVEGTVELDKFKEQYESYCRKNNNKPISMFSVNKGLDAYCERHKIRLVKNCTLRIPAGSEPKSYKTFEDLTGEFGKKKLHEEGGNLINDEPF